ncbi:hypothetical protein PFISCL1PPCAC_21569, partial [Pristionchus fissidentatus]
SSISEMSTLTCSVFLKRHCLMPYMDGQYLISAHGPFLDLVETSKLREGKMDLTSTLPVRTGVFPVCYLYYWLRMIRSGFLLAITSEINSDYRTVVSGCLIHRSTLLTGGKFQ